MSNFVHCRVKKVIVSVASEVLETSEERLVYIFCPKSLYHTYGRYFALMIVHFSSASK